MFNKLPLETIKLAIEKIVFESHVSEIPNCFVSFFKDKK